MRLNSENFKKYQLNLKKKLPKYRYLEIFKLTSCDKMLLYQLIIEKKCLLQVLETIHVGNISNNRFVIILHCIYRLLVNFLTTSCIINQKLFSR